MTDFMMIQDASRPGKLDSYAAASSAASNVFGSSSSASSSCEETESVCSDNSHTNKLQSKSDNADSDLDDYDKLRSENHIDDDMDEDNLSVSSKTHSTCSSSKPTNSKLESQLNPGSRRKQNKPIRIQDQEKELNKAKKQQDTESVDVLANKVSSSATNQPEIQSTKTEPVEAVRNEPKSKSSTLTHNQQQASDADLPLKKDPRISAKIADLLISNKLDQIANTKLISSHLDSPKSPKINSMDTFCTICKKEVCNKYFLKTHLLNKHNVQIEDYLAAQAAGMSASGAGPAASSTGSLSSASSSSSSSSTSSIHENSIDQQLHLTQKLLGSQPGLNSLLGNGTQTADLLAKLSKQGSGIDMKQLSPTKHLAALASMLGQGQQAIDEDEVTVGEQDQEASQAEAIMNLLNLGKQQPSKAGVPANDSDLFKHYFNIAMRQQQQSMDLLGTSLNNVDTMNLSGALNTSSAVTEDFCDICQKQFCNKYYLKKHKIDVHGVVDQKAATRKTMDPADLASVANTNNLTQILMNQLNPLMQIANAQLNQSSPTPSISSASSSSIASNGSHGKANSSGAANDLKSAAANANHSLKAEASSEHKSAKGDAESRIGVLNKVEVSSNEVTCPHCTKVFYNTEFLALHVQNKHGIKKNSDKENTSLLESTTQKISQLLNNSGIASTPGQMNKSSIESPLLQNQPFCEYCNKSFCNKYFLRTHMNKAHGKTLIIENNKNENDEQLDSEAHHFASKVVDRVVCDICNKQVCNKYFLRTHKMRVHGLNPRNKHYFSNNNSQNVSKEASAYNTSAQEADFNENEFDYDEEMPQSEGEEGEMPMRNQSEGSAEPELGEVNSTNKGLSKDNPRRGSTCSNQSNLSILTTSSAHNNMSSNPNATNNNSSTLGNANSQIKSVAAQELANYGYNGASPISSISSFSLNSPSSADLSRKFSQLNKHQLQQQNVQRQQPQSGNRDSYCHLCKRQFCSKYFLKNHMVKRHGMSENSSEVPNDSKYSEDEEEHLAETENGYDDSKVEGMLDESAGGAPIQSEPLSAMSRVSCMICKKEVCNKYFLRQHVQHKHKISFNDYLDKFGVSFSRKQGRPAAGNNQSLNYYNSQQAKLKKYIQMKNKNIRDKKNKHLTNSFEDDEQNQMHEQMNGQTEAIASGRKRKYSGSSSCASYDTISSSSNFNNESKKSRSCDVDDENMFSNQLLQLTNAAEQEGFSDLQAFVIESDEADTTFNDFFRPSMIYLPVKARLNDSLTIQVRLRPAERNAIIAVNNTDKSNLSLEHTLDNHVNSFNNQVEGDDLSLNEPQMLESMCDEDDC